MSKIEKHELKKYYSEISDALLCSAKTKNAFLSELQAQVDEYITSEPEATMESVVLTFGTPEQIGNSFLESSDCTKIKKKLDIKKYILLALAVILLVYVAFIIISLIDVHTEAHGYFEEVIMLCRAAAKEFML